MAKSKAATRKVGRPTDYTPEIGEKILALMQEGYSLVAAAASLGVHRQRIYDWREKHPEMAELIGLAQGSRMLFLEKRLLTATEGPKVTSTIFALKNCSEDWREKAELDVNHKGGIAITISQDDANL